MKNKTGHKKRQSQKIFAILASAGFLFMGGTLLWAANLKIPDFNTFGDRKVSQSTKIYDRTGDVLLYDIHENVRRTIVPLENISRYVKNATVAIEDAEFYEHYGVRPLATFRAIFIQPFRGKGVQGGSTITQQVVKNSILTNERKISRKIKEWFISLKIERVMSKNDILEIYLNESPYGGNIYGVQEASRAFFGKEAKDVSLAESAYIAALPQAPTYYSPYGNNRDALNARKNTVLSRMLELGFISQKEYGEAVKEDVVFLPQEERGIKAPHFVFYVRSYLEKKYGKDAVEKGGLSVITTLDYELQKKAEDIVKTFADKNSGKFNASNAGLVATDPKTGQILVMVGSRDYFDEEIDGNFNISIAHRQPGSAFKPFVYATAFKKGYTPEMVVFDLPTQFQTTCDPEGKPILPETNPDDCYMPVNYDGKYSGPVSLRDALAQSINVPAIKTLYLAGLEDSLQTAKDFGMDSLADTKQYGLTLVLGGGEVSLLDITNAYGIFANEGVKNPHTAILSIKDSAGNIVESFSPRPEKVLDENIAREISDVLSDNDARAPAFGERSYLYFDGYDVAVKTGTTNDYRDAWIVGYTPSISVGAWAGNNDNSPMEKKVAGFIIAPLWNEFMKEYLYQKPNESFKSPNKISDEIPPVLRGVWRGGKTYVIDSISKKLATDYTPDETKEEKVLTDIHSILYWIDKKNPLGPSPEKPEEDPQFSLWEFPVQKWANEQGLKNTNETIPTEYDDVHTELNIPHISISTPQNNSILGGSEKATVTIDGFGSYPLARVNFYINDTLVGSSYKYPFVFSFIPQDTPNIKKTNILRAVGYDTVFNKTSTEIIFSVL